MASSCVLGRVLLAAGLSALAACAPSRPRSLAFPDERGDVAEAALTGLRFGRDLTGTVELAKAGGAWVVLPEGIPADSARLREAFDLLFRLDAGDTVVSRAGDDDSIRALFGLDLGSALTAELLAGRRGAARLLLGGAPGDLGSTYWMMEDGHAIHRASGNKAFLISSEADAWKSRRMFPPFLGMRHIRELRVAWIDSTGARHAYRAVRSGPDSLTLAEPGDGTAGIVRAKALELLGRARQFTVDGFPDPEEAARVRAAASSPESSAVSVEWRLENGEIHRTRTLGENGAHYYALHPSGAVVRLLKWRFRDLAIPVEELVLPLRLGPEPWDGTDYGPPPPNFGVWAPHFRDLPEGEEDGHEHGME